MDFQLPAFHIQISLNESHARQLKRRETCRCENLSNKLFMALNGWLVDSLQIIIQFLLNLSAAQLLPV